ncbi:MAG TPA: peptidase S41 [Porphyromonadaceae bacterium]|nr:peptidase S41 [Porphyromonadaceae bacterium]HBX19029.1 peptidase S41 [Porphyromonadaceae bacterium]HCM21588.1 peptidase S41 [Porphyromonadaceae bacterium]
MNVKSIRLLLSLSLFSILYGCEDTMMNFDNNPKGNFDALWNILDRNYCFFEYKQIDWDSIYAEYSVRITDDMNNYELFDLLGNMLGELEDGHVNLIASHDITRNWEWKDSYPVNFDTSIQDNYLGKNYGIASGMKYKILEDNIGYIYYESFSSDIGHGNLTEVLKQMALCPGIILDVRNNSGGSLTNVNKLAGRFFNQKTLIGYISHKTGHGHNDFSELYPKYIDSYDGLRYQKPVVVLTNRGCYSATNEFVSVMKYSPLVTVIGDKTGGGSGLPFSSELPNGWSVRFSASPMFNAEKEHIEFGIEPDESVRLLQADKDKGLDTLIEVARRFLKTGKIPHK